MDDEDEEDEDSNRFRAASSDGQTIQLKEDAISFDQVSLGSLSRIRSLRWLILSPGSAYSVAECLAHGACLRGFPFSKLYYNAQFQGGLTKEDVLGECGHIHPHAAQLCHIATIAITRLRMVFFGPQATSSFATFPSLYIPVRSLYLSAKLDFVDSS